MKMQPGERLVEKGEQHVLHLVMRGKKAAKLLRRVEIIALSEALDSCVTRRQVQKTTTTVAMRARFLFPSAVKHEILKR
jgi:hypothetical protein